MIAAQYAGGVAELLSHENF